MNLFYKFPHNENILYPKLDIHNCALIDYRSVEDIDFYLATLRKIQLFR